MVLEAFGYNQMKNFIQGIPEFPVVRSPGICMGFKSASDRTKEKISVASVGCGLCSMAFYREQRC